MTYSLQIEKVVGVSDSKTAAGIFSSKITLADSSLGTLVSCIEVSDKGGDEVGTLLADIFEIFSRRLEGAEGGVLEKIRFASQSCSEYLTGKEVEVSFTFCFFWEDACYVAGFGEKVKTLVFEDGKSVEIDFESGSGPVAAGQTYLVATVGLFDFFDTAILKGQTDLSEIIDGLATEVSARENQSEIAAAFIKVEDDRETESRDFEGSESKGNTPEEEEEIENEVSETGVVDKTHVVGDNVKGLKIKVFGIIWREIKHLRHGDIRAVLRLRRNIVLLAVAIGLILSVSVSITVWQKGQRAKDASFRVHLENASSKYNEALGVISLNRGRARQILVEADNDLKAAMKIKSKDRQAQDLASAIAEKLKETETKAQVNFESLSEFSQDVGALSLADGQIVAILADRLSLVDLLSKKATELLGFSQVVSGFVYDNFAFIVSGQKILRVDLVSGKSTEVGEAKGDFDIAVFLGNVYSLSQEGINKIVPIENGYAPATSYLSQKATFASGSRFAIDGSIWATNGGEILKFTRGDREDFTISGIVSGLGELGPIYTDVSSNNLYVIDLVNSALLVIGKDGVYQKAYQAPDFAGASDLVVDEKNGRMYLGFGNKILEAGLE